MSSDKQIDQAALDRLLQGLWDVLKDAPYRAEQHFIKYDIVQDGGEVRWVRNADEVEFWKMWRQAG
jgi:hypothetical protein